MYGIEQKKRERRGNGLRMAIWGGAVGLLLLPLVAMQFTDEVTWTLGDFIVFGAMLLVACGAYELATRLSPNRCYRAAFGLAMVGGFLQVWANLAVGIVGSENNPVNQLFFGVLLVGLLGAAIALLRPVGMARTMTAMVVVQAAAIVYTIVSGAGYDALFTGPFVAMWIASAGLFRIAARQMADAGAAS